MATKEYYVKSWNANFTLNTVNESNVAHADFKNTLEIYFTHAQPTKVEVHYQHADLNNLAGFLRFRQKGAPERDWVEIVNADSTPEPLPVPLDSAAGNNTVYLFDFTGYGLQIEIDTTATVGTVPLSIALRK